jgi:hypothetical protein
MVFVRKIDYTDFVKDLKDQLDKTKLSTFTKTTLNTTLNKINTATKDTFTKEVISVLNNKLTDNINTKYTFVATIKSIIKNTQLKDILTKTELELIENEFLKLKELKTNKDYTPTATDKQNDRHIPFKELRIKLDSHKDKLTQLDHLTYALYTYQPPLRADYNAVRILNDKYSVNELDRKENYYSVKDNKFIMYEYKTSKIDQEANVFTAPKDLQKLITDSLKRTPREYLIYNENIGSVNRPVSANFLGHKIQFISNELFKIPISITDIRHSYASENGLDKRPYTEVEKSAKIMGHSLTTNQLLYKKEYKN